MSSVPTMQAINRGRSIAAESYGAKPSASAAVNTVAIQAAINAAGTGGYVTLLTPGTYEITLGTDPTAASLNTCLHLADDQTFECGRGVTLYLANSSNCYMMRNADPVGRNHRIRLIGGTWDQNGDNNTQNLSTAPYWFAHSIWFLGVDELHIENLRGINADKYVILIADSRWGTARNLWFDTPSDGIHFNGPCSHWLVDNVQGTTHDNMVALVTTEGTYFNGLNTSSGDLTDFTITNIFAEDVLEPVRMTGKSPDSIKDIVVRNLTGSLKSNAVSAVRIMDDSLGGLTGCDMQRILIDGVDLSGGAGGGGAVTIGSATAHNIVIRNVTMRTQAGVWLSGSSVGRVVIDGIVNHSSADQNAIQVSGTVENLSASRIYHRPPAGGADCINITGTVTRMVADDITHIAGGGSAALLHLNGSGSAAPDVNLGTLLCDGATYCFRSGSGTTYTFRGGNLRLKNTTYLVWGPIVASLDALTLEGSSNGRTGANVHSKASTPPRWYSFRLTHEDLSGGSSATIVTLGSLPRGAVIHAVRTKHSTSFTGGSLTGYTISVGTGSNVTKYASAFDVFQATGFGVQQLETNVGLDLINRNETLVARAISVGASTNAATQGACDIEILVSVAALPH